MEYNEYKKFSKEPEDLFFYQDVVEPFYMEIQMDKCDFCKFIETENGRMAMMAFSKVEKRAHDLSIKVNELKKEIIHLECLLTREQDKREHERCFELLETFKKSGSMVDDEIVKLLNERLKYHSERLSK